MVVHCAAERRPDVAEQDHDGVLRVNFLLFLLILSRSTNDRQIF